MLALRWWWRTHITRWYCSHILKHQGKWSYIPVIHRGKPMPILAACMRCGAIANIDYYTRTISFE